MSCGGSYSSNAAREADVQRCKQIIEKVQMPEYLLPYLHSDFITFNKGSLETCELPEEVRAQYLEDCHTIEQQRDQEKQAVTDYAYAVNAIPRPRYVKTASWKEEYDRVEAHCSRMRIESKQRWLHHWLHEQTGLHADEILHRYRERVYGHIKQVAGISHSIESDFLLGDKRTWSHIGFYTESLEYILPTIYEMYAVLACQATLKIQATSLRQELWGN